jgi:hypothetical protein
MKPIKPEQFRQLLTPALFLVLIFNSTSEANDSTELACRPENEGKTIIENNRLVTCDTEDYTAVDITPPPTAAIRPIENLANSSNITLKKPEQWPLRAMYWRYSGDGTGHWVEFDKQGNVLKSNFQNKDISLREPQRNGLPVWTGGQHIYGLIESEEAVKDGYLGFYKLTRTKNQVCPVRGESTEYNYYREQNDSSGYISRNCEMAITKTIRNTNFLIYPEDSNNSDTIEKIKLLWATQYFSDPISPLLNEKGECLAYCDTQKQTIKKTKNEKVTKIITSEKIDARPPPKNSIKMLSIKEREMTEGDLETVLPEEWPVRAIFNSQSGVFEFDKEGILLERSEKTRIRAVETRYGRDPGTPVWKSPKNDQKIYKLINLDQDYSEYTTHELRSGLIITDKIVCPTQIISEAFGMIHEDGRFYLNGNCRKSVKKEIGTGEFFIYPEDINSDHPQYWSIQYFKDPISPVIDAHGQCWLYCNQ